MSTLIVFALGYFLGGLAALVILGLTVAARSAEGARGRRAVRSPADETRAV